MFFRICILSHFILFGRSEEININLVFLRKKERKKHIHFVSVISSPLLEHLLYARLWAWYVSDQAASNFVLSGLRSCEGLGQEERGLPWRIALAAVCTVGWKGISRAPV